MLKKREKRTEFQVWQKLEEKGRVEGGCSKIE